jgi:Domain of unknown function (DUF5067)
MKRVTATIALAAGRIRARGGARASSEGSQMKKPLISLICTASALALLLCACGNESSSSSTKDGGSVQTFSPAEGNGADDSPDVHAPTFKNGVLTTPDMRIRILRYKVIKPRQKGNEYGSKPVIAFWYKTTNLSSKQLDPLTGYIVAFKAVQDNNPNAENDLEVGSAPDNRFLESQSENIKKGGTVENAVAYELDDLTTPVQLVASEGFDQVVGKAVYKLR